MWTALFVGLVVSAHFSYPRPEGGQFDLVLLFLTLYNILILLCFIYDVHSEDFVKSF